MRIRVKICGITDGDGLRAAVDAGADAVGFVLASSPRQVSVEQAARLVAMTPAFVTRVAVLRHPTDDLLRDVADMVRPDRIQLEWEDAARLPAAVRDRVIPVFHDDDALVERIAASVPPGGTIHLEGPGRGGRGVPVDPERAAQVAGRVRLILAGGLGPENVAEAVRRVRPWAVDVSSGVEEAPGLKDPMKMRAFVSAVRELEEDA